VTRRRRLVGRRRAGTAAPDHADSCTSCYWYDTKGQLHRSKNLI